MLRISMSFIAIVLLTGCASTPLTASSNPPVTTEPTIIEQLLPTEAAITESPSGENTMPASEPQIQEYAVPPGTHPHDVAPALDGSVWYTAQISGALGKLDPATGETKHIPLGSGSSPHGVIVGPDGAPWITDSGLNAIVRVDPQIEEVRKFP